MTLHVDDRVKFEEEKAPYKVRAITPDGRYAICTKPFNPQRTVLYSVVDQWENRRGPDNYAGLGYETPDQIARAAGMFATGEAELSHRYGIYARIERVDCPHHQKDAA